MIDVHPVSPLQVSREVAVDPPASRDRERRHTPAERILSLSRAIDDPTTELARAIIRREIALSLPRVGMLGFVRKSWRSDRQTTVICAVLGSGLIRRGNELAGRSTVDIRLRPRLSAAYARAAGDLKKRGIEVQVIRTAYNGVELGAAGPLGDERLAEIHEVLEQQVRSALDGFHVSLDIALAELPFAITVGAEVVDAPSFAAMLRAYMRAHGAAKAARVLGGFAFHSVEQAASILERYRCWVEANNSIDIAGLPAVDHDPVGGRTRVNLDVLAAASAGSLAPLVSQRMAEIRSALNVLDWSHSGRSDQLADEAARTKTALDWIERLEDDLPISSAQLNRLEQLMVSIHPRLAFVRAATTAPATLFLAVMKNLRMRSLSICERVASELLERGPVTEAALDAARVRQNDLVQALKEVLDAAVDAVRAKVGAEAELFAERRGDGVIIGVRIDGAPLSEALRLEVASRLAAVSGVRVGTTESSGAAHLLDEEVGGLEHRMSETLKKLERLDCPARCFLDGTRLVTVAP